MGTEEQHDGKLPTLDLELYLEDVRRILFSQMGSDIRKAELDEDDVLQEVYIGILRKQGMPRSRWDPKRGRSERSYLFMVTCSVGRQVIAKARRRARNEQVGMRLRDDHLVADGTYTDASLVDIEAEALPDLVLGQVLSRLPSKKSRRMAVLIMQGATLDQMKRRLRLKSKREARELRDLVHAQLHELLDGGG